MNRSTLNAQLLEAVEHLQSAQSRQGFVEAAISSAEICFRGAVVAYHEVSAGAPDPSSHECKDPRVGENLRAAWKRHALASPVVQYYLAGGTDPVVATQDLVPDVALRCSALYAECWKPFGSRYQIGLRLWQPNFVAGLSIKRETRFTHSEKLTARTLYSFFLQGYRRVLANQLSSSGRLELLLDYQGRPVGCSAKWKSRLRHDRMAEQISAHVSSLREQHNGTFSFAVAGATCHARQIAGHLYRVLVDIHATESTPPDALTRRETDVLSWLACGKRDAEIAVILGIAPKTVSKHVEHLLAKLGVETRTAAARFAPNELWPSK